MAVVGLGMDICSVERIQRILDSPRRQKFLERVYTVAERQLCSNRYDTAAAYAARFAAKEALYVSRAHRYPVSKSLDVSGIETPKGPAADVD